MKFLGTLFGAAVVTAAGVGYYAYRRHCDTGQSYLDIVRQLPGEVQRRATDAMTEGRAAARRRDDELQRQLQTGSTTPAPAAAATFGGADMPPVPEAPPSTQPPTAADGDTFSTPVSAVS
jgi:hypothetical protein